MLRMKDFRHSGGPLLLRTEAIWLCPSLWSPGRALHWLDLLPHAEVRRAWEMEPFAVMESRAGADGHGSQHTQTNDLPSVQLRKRGHLEQEVLTLTTRQFKG